MRRALGKASQVGGAAATMGAGVVLLMPALLLLFAVSAALIVRRAAGFDSIPNTTGDAFEAARSTFKRGADSIGESVHVGHFQRADQVSSDQSSQSNKSSSRALATTRVA